VFGSAEMRPVGSVVEVAAMGAGAAAAVTPACKP
jgi:hypothetical protein